MKSFLLPRLSIGLPATRRVGASPPHDRRFKRRRRAQTLLEFALLLPVLLLLLLGMIQFGIVANKKLALSHTSRDGGRFAAVNALKPDIDSQIKQRIISTAEGHGLVLTAADISLSPAQNTSTTLTNRQQYNALTVVINYNMKPNLFLPGRFFDFPIFPETASTSTQVIME